MFWLDLCLSGLCLWSGIAGYLAGWKNSTLRLAALAATVATAAAFKGDMRVFITLQYPVDEAIKALIISRIAVPVGAFPASHGAILQSFGLPDLLQTSITEKAAFAAASSVSGMVELLTAVMLNVLSFMAAILLWWGAFYLAGLYGLRGGHTKLKACDRIGGMLAGIFKQVLLIVLIAGSTAPFLWLLTIPGEVFDPQQSVLFRWSLQLFHDTGVWWN